MRNLSRRHMLMLAGAAGGSPALLKTGIALGLISSDAFAAPVSVTPASGDATKTVVVLGAGIGGLMATYELEQAGYNVVLLEASHRAGGRNLTLRHGDKIDEMGHTRYCKFDQEDNLFFNAGPARIPGHHTRFLHYCRALKVPLQIKANSNKMAYTHDESAFDGKPKRIVEYHSDARGLMAELLWKASDQSAFDQMLSEEDVEKLMSFARVHGALQEDGSFTGSDRGGSTKDRMLHHPSPHLPMELSALLDSSFWQGGLLGAENYDWIEPLMEIQGGMDGIVKGFLNHLKSKPHLGAQVKKIINVPDGVEVTYEQGGEFKTIKADYCFNNIPAYFMAGIENNFSSNYMAGLNSYGRGRLFKIGLQMKERFWEEEGIYGGITYTTQPVSQIWYPSHDIHAEKGILLAAYTWGSTNTAAFESMTPEERIQVAIECGEKIHPGYGSYVENGVSIPWARMNHQMGCGISQSPEDFETYYALMQKPEGRHFMIGDQISHHSGWTEGALASTEQALQQFNTLVGQHQAQAVAAGVANHV